MGKSAATQRIIETCDNDEPVMINALTCDNDEPVMINALTRMGKVGIFDSWEEARAVCAIADRLGLGATAVIEGCKVGWRYGRWDWAFEAGGGQVLFDYDGCYYQEYYSNTNYLLLLQPQMLLPL